MRQSKLGSVMEETWTFPHFSAFLKGPILTIFKFIVQNRFYTNERSLHNGFTLNSVAVSVSFWTLPSPKMLDIIDCHVKMRPTVRDLGMREFGWPNGSLGYIIGKWKRGSGLQTRLCGANRGGERRIEIIMSEPKQLQLQVEGLSNLMTTLKEHEGKRRAVMFMGSMNESGESWCPDCRDGL